MADSAHNHRELTREMLLAVLNHFSTLLPPKFNNSLVRLVVHGGACMLLHPDLDRLAAQTPPFLPGVPLPPETPDVKRTQTRDVDIITRSFDAEWRQFAIFDASARLKDCIAATARKFGLGKDWMNSDADVALPMAVDPVTGVTYDPIHHDALKPNNILLHTIYKAPNGMLQLVSVTPFWAVALKLVRYTKSDPGDICLILRNGTNLSGTRWTTDLVEKWLVENCWPMGYASYDHRRWAQLRFRIDHVITMVNAYDDEPESREEEKRKSRSQKKMAGMSSANSETPFVPPTPTGIFQSPPPEKYTLQPQPQPQSQQQLPASQPPQTPYSYPYPYPYPPQLYPAQSYMYYTQPYPLATPLPPEPSMYYTQPYPPVSHLQPEPSTSNEPSTTHASRSLAGWATPRNADAGAKRVVDEKEERRQKMVKDWLDANNASAPAIPPPILSPTPGISVRSPTPESQVVSPPSVQQNQRRHPSFSPQQPQWQIHPQAQAQPEPQPQLPAQQERNTTPVVPTGFVPLPTQREREPNTTSTVMPIPSGFIPPPAQRERERNGAPPIMPTSTGFVPPPAQRERERNTASTPTGFMPPPAQRERERNSAPTLTGFVPPPAQRERNSAPSTGSIPPPAQRERERNTTPPVIPTSAGFVPPPPGQRERERNTAPPTGFIPPPAQRERERNTTPPVIPTPAGFVPPPPVQRERERNTAPPTGFIPPPAQRERERNTTPVIPTPTGFVPPSAQRERESNTTPPVMPTPTGFVPPPAQRRRERNTAPPTGFVPPPAQRERERNTTPAIPTGFVPPPVQQEREPSPDTPPVIPNPTGFVPPQFSTEQRARYGPYGRDGPLGVHRRSWYDDEVEEDEADGASTEVESEGRSTEIESDEDWEEARIRARSAAEGAGAGAWTTQGRGLGAVWPTSAPQAPAGATQGITTVPLPGSWVGVSSARGSGPEGAAGAGTQATGGRRGGIRELAEMVSGKRVRDASGSGSGSHPTTTMPGPPPQQQQQQQQYQPYLSSWISSSTATLRGPTTTTNAMRSVTPLEAFVPPSYSPSPRPGANNNREDDDEDDEETDSDSDGSIDQNTLLSFPDNGQEDAPQAGAIPPQSGPGYHNHNQHPQQAPYPYPHPYPYPYPYPYPWQAPTWTTNSN